MHELEPFENVPAGQLAQISSYWQFEHSIEPSKENFPSGQSIHWLPLKKEPFGHLKVEFDKVIEPNGQMEHESEPVSE